MTTGPMTATAAPVVNITWRDRAVNMGGTWVLVIKTGRFVRHIDLQTHDYDAAIVVARREVSKLG